MTALFGRVVTNPRRLALNILRNPRVWLPHVICGLNAERARVKFGCAKALRDCGERRPELLYPEFDYFVRQLRHRNKILQWEAARMLSFLASVDVQRKFDRIFRRYFAPIRGPEMITAATVIQSGARVAGAKPYLADRIAGEILKVERGRYQTPTCRDIAIGHAIAALSSCYWLLNDRGRVLRFVRRQTRNARPATRKKAQRFLEQLG